MPHEITAPKLAHRIVDFIRHRPWVALALGVVLLLGLLPGMSRIEADFSHRGFFWTDDPLLIAFDEFERRFGNDDQVVVALHSPSGIFDADSMAVLQELTERMWQVPEVIRVDSLSNYNWVHADGDELIVEPFIPDDQELTAELLEARKEIALAHEVMPSYLVSRDAKTAMIFGTIKPGIDAPPDAPKIIGAVRDLKKELSRGDHVMHISGGPAVTLGFSEASQNDFALLVPMLLLCVILLLANTFRSFVGVALSLVVIFASVMASMAIGGWLGIQITNVTAVLPQVIIAIGVANAVHIMVTFLRRMARGMSRADAAHYSLLKNFMPTLITSITTAVGFLSFASANLKPISGLGTLAGIGTLLAWFFGYFVLGSLLFILPIKRKELPNEHKESAERRAAWYTTRLSRIRVPLIAGFSVLCLVSIGLATQNTVNSDPFKYFREGFPLRVANEFIENNVGGARGVDVVVDAGQEEGIKDPAFLARVEAFQLWMDQIPNVTRTVSIIDVLKQTNRSLHGDDQAEYRLPTDREVVAQELFLYQMSLPQGMNLNDRITVKNDALRITVLWTIATSAESVAAIELIEAKGKEMGLTASVTGKNRLWQSINGYVVETFIVSLSAAVFLISLILIIFFRSLKLGLLAMIPNAVPLLIGAGVLRLIGNPLDIGTVLVMSICLGIAVDDTIHILANYGRLRKEGKSARLAIEDIMAHTSPALIATSTILVIAFGTFAFGTFTPNIYLGIMTAIILTIALLTDLTLLPAILLLGSKETAEEKSQTGAETEAAVS